MGGGALTARCRGEPQVEVIGRGGGEGLVEEALEREMQAAERVRVRVQRNGEGPSAVMTAAAACRGTPRRSRGPAWAQRRQRRATDARWPCRDRGTEGQLGHDQPQHRIGKRLERVATAAAAVILADGVVANHVASA